MKLLKTNLGKANDWLRASLTGLALSIIALGDFTCMQASAEANAQTSTQGKAQLLAQASPQANEWNKRFELAVKAYNFRIYDEAQRKLSVLNKLQSGLAGSNIHYIKARVLQAKVYYAEGKLDLAAQTYAKCSQLSKNYSGPDSLVHADCLAGLAQIALVKGDAKKAAMLCDQALAIKRKYLNESSRALGTTYTLSANISFALGAEEQARESFVKAIEILRKDPGPQELDLADALRDYALFNKEMDHLDDATKDYEESFALKEKAVRFTQPACLRGLINFPWDDGMPGCSQIVDGKFPLKSITVNGLKVSACTVDLRNIIGVLVSLENVTPSPMTVGVGPAQFKITKPGTNVLKALDHKFIDETLEEETFWGQTWRQESLRFLQATFIPPLPKNPNLGDIPQSNVFGDWGKWPRARAGAPHIVPTHALLANAQSILDPLAKGASQAHCLNLNGIYIEPNSSRSSILFYQYQPWNQAKVEVSIGNTVYELPFQFQGKL
jgi:tetratricopeptide (TPR) repeat protein